MEQLIPNTPPAFIGFPILVPDVCGASDYLNEFREFEKNENFPNFKIMLSPANNTSGTRLCMNNALVFPGNQSITFYVHLDNHN